MVIQAFPAINLGELALHVLAGAAAFLNEEMDLWGVHGSSQIVVGWARSQAGMAGADCVSVAEVFVSVLEGVVVDGGVDQVVGIGRLGGQHIHREHRRRRHKGSCHTTSESTNNSAIKSAITSAIKTFYLSTRLITTSLQDVVSTSPIRLIDLGDSWGLYPPSGC